jgi:inner membrane protein
MDAFPTAFDRLNTWMSGSVTLKLLSIGVLLLLLLIPSSMVEGLITERAENRDAATAEISSQWGGAQLVLGPVLVLPYTARITDEKGNVSEITRYLSLLPDTLATTGSLAPERRHRGIYEAVVYRASLHVQGAFQAPPLADLGVPPANVRWAEAFVAVGISDMKGIRNALALRWDGQTHRFEPGVPNAEVLPFGTAPTLTTQVSTVVNERQRYTKYRDDEEEAGGRGQAANGLGAPSHRNGPYTPPHLCLRPRPEWQHRLAGGSPRPPNHLAPKRPVGRPQLYWRLFASPPRHSARSVHG